MKANQYLKIAESLVTAIARAKSTAVKSKTSILKNRLQIVALFHMKVWMGAASHLNNLLLMGKRNGKVRFGQTKFNMQDNSLSNEVRTNKTLYTDHGLHGDSDDDCPNSRDSFSHSEDEESEYEQIGTETVISLIRCSQEDEDDVDCFADLFIRRFYRQLWMQKQNFFKGHDLDMVFPDM